MNLPGDADAILAVIDNITDNLGDIDEILTGRDTHPLVDTEAQMPIRVHTALAVSQMRAIAVVLRRDINSWQDHNS